jgi:hypothetical protein
MDSTEPTTYPASPVGLDRADAWYAALTLGLPLLVTVLAYGVLALAA